MVVGGAWFTAGLFNIALLRVFTTPAKETGRLNLKVSSFLPVSIDLAVVVGGAGFSGSCAGFTTGSVGVTGSTTAWFSVTVADGCVPGLQRAAKT